MLADAAMWPNMCSRDLMFIEHNTAVDDEGLSAVTDDTESRKIDDNDDNNTVSTTGTELLLKTPEKLEKTEEIGTEFLLGDTDHKVPAAEEPVTSSTVGTTRRRKSRVDAEADPLDESGPGREMNDITADALSIQPTGYTLETAHVSFS